MNEIRERVRERYAKSATELAAGAECGPDCCGSPSSVSFVEGYRGEELAQLHLDPGLSLGCGNPLLLADLHPGETVLDLGSGAGLDVLLSARRVAPGGTAYGLDMTDEMLALAEANREKAGVDNARFLKGTLEDIPLPADTVDVVISNCVINLAGDKGLVLREAFRVLRPGGRLAVSDMVELKPLPPETKARVDAWAGCVSGTIPVDDYRRLLTEAGFEDATVDVATTYNLEGAEGAIASAYVRARRPVA